MDDDHTQRRQRDGQMLDGREQPVDDGIDDAALLEHQVDGPREANEQRRIRHGAKSLDVRLGGARDPEPPDEPRENPRDEEQGGHLIEVPSEPAIQSGSAITKKPKRKIPPDSNGSPASCWAMPT